MRIIKNSIQINNLKLKRENLELKQILVSELTRELKDQSYDRWVAKTKKYIDSINEQIRIAITKEIADRKKLAADFKFTLLRLNNEQK